VAADLRDRWLGTLLMELFTPDEEAVDARTRQLRFEIGLLAGDHLHRVRAPTLLIVGGRD
jgi:hypothetical protein